MNEVETWRLVLRIASWKKLAENCKIALLTAKNMGVVEYNSAAWLIAVDKYVLRWLVVDLCIFL